MKCYSSWNSPENKQKRSERASRNATRRWEAYHAQFADDPITLPLPDDMYRLTFSNLMSGKTTTLTFHPGTRRNNYRIDVDGVYWKTTGLVAALRLIEKSLYKMKRSD